MRAPTFQIERELLAQGYRAIVGVDEAGCGALAGPLMAGAAILPLDSRIGDLRDSKLLTEKARRQLYEEVVEKATAWAVAEASVEEINTLGLRVANLLAMRRAVDQIAHVEYVLIDAWRLPNLPFPQRGIVRGDRLVKSIAAASVLAKVTRDRKMEELAEQFPAYRFEIHKGYATEAHQKAIKQYGPCPIHRTSWKPFIHDK
jgi:ribonuclease HII